MPDVSGLRLLVVSNNYPPHVLGGYELICAQHVAWLRQRGHEVTVLTSTFGLADEATVAETGAAGERVVRCLRFNWRDYQHDRLRGLALFRNERRQRDVVQRLLREVRPQAAAVWGMAAVSKAPLAMLHDSGVPMVAMLGENWPLWDIKADAWLRFWRRPWLAPLRGWAAAAYAPVDVQPALSATHPAFVSRALAQEIEARCPELRGRGQVVPNGIEVEAFATPSPPRVPDPANPRLLYVGRVERRKGPHTAVEALAELRAQGLHPELDLVGWRDDAYVSELEALAAQLGVADAVHILDPVPREALAGVYRAHDVLVFPSLWAEPFGLVGLEAMACGTAVVATGRGGSADYLRDGENCLLYEPGDGVGAAAAIRRLFDDRALADRLRQAGLRTATEHSFERFASALEAMLVGAASAEPAARG